MFDTSPLSLHMEAALRRLVPERRKKAERLQRGEARRQSVGAGLLLAHFFPGRTPQPGPGGKPYIPGERCFSLSHSGAMVVIALGDVQVGVDIERAAPVPEALRRRVLSRAERDSGTDFFTLWTRKEAALKCIGAGVDRPLRTVDVRADTVFLDGHTVHLRTVTLEEYTLTAAAMDAPVAFTLRVLTPEELLAPQEANQ